MLAMLLLLVAPADEVRIPSSRDGVQQPALLYVPPGDGPAPMLVCLHSWSSTYRTAEYQADILEGCRKRGWIFLLPDFRGPNHRPEACASTLAVQDVIDAVAYARQHASVDPRRVFLVGGSGGGHMALQMAAHAPGLWSAVSAWVPITDLAAWYRFSKAQDFRYWKMMEQCCGGPPGSPASDREYRLRSPLDQLAKAAALPIDIQAGIHDGHGGAAVPISHSLRAFNLLARAGGHPDRILNDEEIRVMTDEGRIPGHLARETAEESGRKHRVLFRRSAGPARLTIFDGGHVLDSEAALAWFDSFAGCAAWHNRAVKLDFPRPVWYRIGAGTWTGLFNLGTGCLYASGGNGSLYRIDTETGRAEYLGTPVADRPSRLSSMRPGPDGAAWAVAGMMGRCDLLRFDPRAETWELLGEVRDGEAACWQIHDIAVTAEGTVYAAENDNPHRSSYLWEIVP